MIPKRRTADELLRYGQILVGQSRELCDKLSRPIPAVRSEEFGNDLQVLAAAVSDAHNHLANVRSTRVDSASATAWEKASVDGRSGDDIFDRLADVIEELQEMDRNGE